MGNAALNAMAETLKIAEENLPPMMITDRIREKELLDAASGMDVMVAEFKAVWVDVEVEEETDDIIMSAIFKLPPYFESCHPFWKICAISSSVRFERDPDGDKLLILFRFPGIWESV